MSFIPGECNTVGEFWFGGDDEYIMPDYRILGLDDGSGLEDVLAVAEAEGVPRSSVRGVRISDRIVGSESAYPWTVRLTWSPGGAA
jgi:hypothetical protein